MKMVKVGTSKRHVMIILFSILLLMFIPMGAYGADTVSNLKITLKNVKEPGVVMEPQISISPSNCEIVGITWSKETEDWRPGKYVFVELVIAAPEGRTFASTYSSRKCQISGGDYRSAKADPEDPSLLKVSVRYIPVVELGGTESAGWNEKNAMIATWKKVPFATQYDVRIYDGDRLIKTVECTGSSLNLGEYITGEGDYRYEVRAKGKTESEKKYLFTGEYVSSDDSMVISSEELGDIGGSWSNHQEGRKYRAADGTNPVSCWKMIMGVWYYFDENGYVVTGWHQDPDGAWYYSNEKGEMQTGWLELNGIKYFFQQSGAMMVGWVEEAPGQWRYFNPDGSMAVNTTIDGQYTINKDGLYHAGP